MTALKSAGLFTVALAVLTVFVSCASAQRGSRRDRFTFRGTIESESDPAADPRRRTARVHAGEAPAGFDNLTNGYTPQGPDYDTLEEEDVVPLRSFNDNRFSFEEVETIADGLGPVYNAQSCRECHQSVVTGGARQVAEHRTGRVEKVRRAERRAEGADPRLPGFAMKARDPSSGPRPHLSHTTHSSRSAPSTTTG
jgi:hypothetical protein